MIWDIDRARKGTGKKRSVPYAVRSSFPQKNGYTIPEGYQPKRVCSYHCSLEAQKKKKGNKWEETRKKLRERNKEIYELYRQGYTINQLVEKYGMINQTIWRIIAEMKSAEDKR